MNIIVQQQVPASARNSGENTIPHLLERGLATSPAIGAPCHAPITYGALRHMVHQFGQTLHDAGIVREDRVAVVLPNGPEMAVAFLAVSSVATVAPLNPAYGAEELAFAFDDLSARALIVPAEGGETARAVAAARGIPVLELTGVAGAHGAFSISSPPHRLLSGDRWQPALPDDIALVLHTSGTTARPKVVPLSHGNLAASAGNIGRALALTEADVCLNIMPLFHIHGLVAAVLASLAAGGSVVCCPGLNAFRFFTWLAEARPTWFTAVPTMLQTLLELAPRHRETIAASRLRLVRSSSASLPAPVMTRLEAAFGVPVIEAYGMTEAAHQMASNPLPPAARYPGCVGVAAGPEIAIMDDAGSLLPPGAEGEVVIRGANVTRGYDRNPGANAQSFSNGWFRTGDQGVLDDAGYLRLTGRLKEIINRAGEKVSPLEIDQILLEHPAVAQVVTFAMPSRLYGEEVAAAIVRRDGFATDAEELQTFVADRVAPFKVPREIVFLTEIPKGATGKLQRIGLAAKLNLGDQA